MTRWLWVALIATGCDEASTSEASDTRDVAEVPDEVTPPRPCDAVALDDVTLGAGQLLRVPLHGATLAATLPSALTRVVAADTFVVRADYTTTGTLAIPVTLTCGDGERSLLWHVTLRPMSWTAAPAWTDATGPSAREHTLFWIEPARPDVMLLYGGFRYEPTQGTSANDAFELDLQTLTWSPRAMTGDAPRRGAGRAFPAPSGGGLWYHGGDVDGVQTAGIDAFDPTTSRWSVAPVDRGPAVSLHATVLDAARDRVITALGVRKSFVLSTVVGALDLATGAWGELAVTTPGPDARYGFAYALHDDRLIIASGARAPVSGDVVNAAPDVWALELAETPARWVELDVRGGDHAFRNAAFALDAESERLFVFGGTADGATAIAGLHVLELTRGAERWVHLPTTAYTNAPPPDRASCSGIWDPKRRRLLVGFGNSEVGLFTDLWALSL